MKQNIERTRRNGDAYAQLAEAMHELHPVGDTPINVFDPQSPTSHAFQRAGGALVSPAEAKATASARGESPIVRATSTTFIARATGTYS